MTVYYVTDYIACKSLFVTSVISLVFNALFLVCHIQISTCTRTHTHAHTSKSSSYVSMHCNSLHPFQYQNISYSPCVKQSVQTKINPSPYTIQVCKVMDAAQQWWSVVSAGGDRARYFLCSHLIVHQNRKGEKSRRDPTSQSLSRPSVSLHSSLSEAHAVCEWSASESPVREGANHPGSQSAQQPVRQRDGGGR